MINSETFLIIYRNENNTVTTRIVNKEKCHDEDLKPLKQFPFTEPHQDQIFILSYQFEADHFKYIYLGSYKVKTIHIDIKKNTSYTTQFISQLINEEDKRKKFIQSLMAISRIDSPQSMLRHIVL